MTDPLAQGGPTAVSDNQRPFDDLFADAYDQLRQMAGRERARWSRSHTLSTTALVHEVYVKLARQRGGLRNGDRLYAVAKRRAMRSTGMPVGRSAPRIQLSLTTPANRSMFPDEDNPGEHPPPGNEVIMSNPGSFGAGALALVLILAGCEAAEPEPETQAASDRARVDLEAEEQAIREADAAMLEAARSGDATSFADAFAPEGRLMFPYAPTAEGRDDIQAKSEGDFGAPGFEVEWTTESIDVAESGDMAYSVGRYNLGIETPNGPMQDEGKFLTVWEKVDGEWKVAADMIATDQPPPGAGSPES